MATTASSRGGSLRSVISHPVVAVGLGLVTAQALFRAWAIYPSWFYTDDYRLLYDATSSDLDLSYLTSPFDSQFMPIGRLIVWVVAHSGTLNWPLAASITLALQVVAALACLWMLVVLFGARWGIVPLLLVYLTSALTMPAFMWWAAALNQMLLQTVFFGAVGAGVAWLRDRRRTQLALLVGLLVLGLLTYVKTLLLAPLLAALTLGWFTTGPWHERLLDAVRRYWVALALGAVLVSGYLAYYLLEVPQPFEQESDGEALDLAWHMVGTTFLTGVFGGPWRWAVENPPVATVNPPGWAHALAGVAALAVVLASIMFRHRALRAWVLLFGYLAALWLLVLTSRAAVIGPMIGLEPRYLTDAVCAVVLCIGLAFLPVRGATEPSALRGGPSRCWLATPHRVAVGALTGVVTVLGVASSASYAHVWHTDHPGADYVQQLDSDLSRVGTVHLADTVVPQAVIPGYSHPYNTTRRLAPLVDPDVRFPDATGELAVVDTDGTLSLPRLDGSVSSPPGPQPNCGWPIRDGRPTTIPLASDVFELDLWMRIDYLASGNTTVRVRTGAATTEASVNRGLDSLYVRTEGGFGQIEVTTVDASTALCVGAVEVGTIAPGEGL